MQRDFEPYITVVDAQGGGMGRAVIKLLKETLPQARVISAGTNAIATAAMLKAGADIGATGENAVIYNCGQAKILIAPIGFMIPDAMYGEVTAAMALAFGKSDARKILIPARQSHIFIAGLAERPLAVNIEEAVKTAVVYAKEIFGIE